jgi:hypothetical protein
MGSVAHSGAHAALFIIMMAVALVAAGIAWLRR